MPSLIRQITALARQLTRVVFGLVLLQSVFVASPAADLFAQQRTEIKTDEPEEASEAEDKAKPVSTSEEVEKAGDDDGETAVWDGQFRKNVSPSGLQLGLANPETADELPEEIREFAQQGALASAEKDWKEAFEAYKKMVKAAPEHPLALANLGMVEYRLEMYESARNHLAHSLTLSPKVAHHWMVLALCHYDMENNDLALSCLFRARHEDKTDPRVHLYLAVIARDYGWPIAAETELQRAVNLDPHYSDAHFNLALLYMERTPPSIELARRHYFIALDLGAKPDEGIEDKLKSAAGTR